MIIDYLRCSGEFFENDLNSRFWEQQAFKLTTMVTGFWNIVCTLHFVSRPIYAFTAAYSLLQTTFISYHVISDMNNWKRYRVSKKEF